MKKSRVFVDGALVGLIDDPKSLVENIRAMRRQGAISTEVNISYKEFNGDVVLLTDRGRARRPLIVLKDGKPLISEDEIKKLAKKEIRLLLFREAWDDRVRGCRGRRRPLHRDESRGYHARAHPS